MCGRYTVTDPEEIAESLEAALDPQVAADPWWKPRFNVAPTQPAPIVALRGGARAIELMRWGLVPHWVEPGGKKPPLMINARVESLTAKQMFREALEHRRCLVPASGFFEWVSARGGAGDKPAPQPFYFHPRARRLFAFAGLWARSRDARGELHSFTIITTRANPLVRAVHDRMPIILSPADHAAWLSAELDADAARGLLGHPAGDDWMADAVSTWVNKADHDDPRCIEPVAEPASRQQRLFD